MSEYHNGPQPDRTPPEDKPWFSGGLVRSGVVILTASKYLTGPHRIQGQGPVRYFDGPWNETKTYSKRCGSQTNDLRKKRKLIK